MKIIRNQNTESKKPFSTIRGEKDTVNILRDGEKDLLGQIAHALTVIYGGEMKSRRGVTA